MTQGGNFRMNLKNKRMKAGKSFAADQEENAELEKKDIVYDNVAIPEIHFHHKKKSK